MTESEFAERCQVYGKELSEHLVACSVYKRGEDVGIKWSIHHNELDKNGIIITIHVGEVMHGGIMRRFMTRILHRTPNVANPVEMMKIGVEAIAEFTYHQGTGDSAVYRRVAAYPDQGPFVFETLY